MSSFRIEVRENRGHLIGDDLDQVDAELQDKYAWYDVNDLADPTLFYKDGRMFLGLVHSVAEYLQSQGHDCEIVYHDVPRLHDWKFTGEFRPNQKEAVETMLKDRYGIVKAPTAFGKTVAMSAIAAYAGLPTAIVVQDSAPFDSAVNTLKAFTTIKGIGQVNGAKKDLGVVTVYMLQSLLRAVRSGKNQAIVDHFRNADVVMVDECFPMGTMIGDVPIQDIKEGDLTRSYNHDTGLIELQKVVRTYKRQPEHMVRVCFGDGTYLDCTAGHPFWIGEEYLPAIRLASWDYVYTDTHGTKFLRTHEIEQPNEQPRDLGEDAPDNDSAGTQAKGTWRKWDRYVSLRTKVVRSIAWVERALRNLMWQRMPIGGLPDSLQARYGSSESEAGGGSGRTIALRNDQATSGCKEDTILRGPRVDHIEVYQPSSDDRFGNVCPDGYVYNIEVEHNHNYFANGILVHNCHHVASEGFLDVLDVPKDPKYLIGFSATPDVREDGYQPFIDAYLGKPRFVVSFGEQVAAGGICPLTIFIYNVPPKDYGYSSQIDLPMWRKRKYYEKVYNEYVIHNKERNEACIEFCEEMISNNQSVAIIVSRTEHADVIHKMYPSAVILTGKMKSEERRDIMYKLRQKEIMCVVTTLFEEATDIPSLGAVCIMAGGKSEIKLKQRIRSSRTFSGQTAKGYYNKVRGYVWYPKDNADYVRSHSVKCEAILQKLAKEHPRNKIIWL